MVRQTIPMSALLFCALSAVPAFGQSAAETPLEPASEQALLQTKELLRDSKARDEAVSKDPKAKSADENVTRLAGSKAAADAIYDLSADVMETVTREAKGDPEKMRSLLVDALRDPEKFAAKLTPEQKAKLEAIGQKVPDPTPKKTPP